MNTHHKSYRTIFFGTPEFAVPSLRALLDDEHFDVVAVVTQPDRPVGRKQLLTPPPVKVLAEGNKVLALQPEKIKNNQDFQQQLTELKPDVIVVVAYGKILPKWVLGLPIYGAINVHGSYLPKYRGAAPVSAAIIAGDTNTAVTIQKMVLAMDEGPILAAGNPIPIEPTDTTASLSAKLSADAAEILTNIVLSYIEKRIAPVPQNEGDATYVTLLKKEDGIIDWREPAELIERKIRAYTPWPSATAQIGNITAKLIRARVIESGAAPGIVSQTADGFAVGNLEILELQPSGKKPMSAKAFLAGHPDLIGQSVL